MYWFRMMIFMIIWVILSFLRIVFPCLFCCCCHCVLFSFFYSSRLYCHTMPNHLRHRWLDGFIPICFQKWFGCVSGVLLGVYCACGVEKKSNNKLIGINRLNNNNKLQSNFNNGYRVDTQKERKQNHPETKEYK